MTQQAQAQTASQAEALELATTELDAVVGGGFGVTKVGAGKLELSASSNTYRGTTTVNDGTLL